MFQFFKSNKSLSYILMFVILILITSVVIAYAPVTEKGKHYWQNVIADIKGKNRKATIYNCNNNSIINVYQDSEMRFEVLEEGKGIRIWLGNKKQKISTNMCWVIEDID